MRCSRLAIRREHPHVRVSDDQLVPLALRQRVDREQVGNKPFRRMIRGEQDHCQLCERHRKREQTIGRPASASFGLIG